MASLALADFDPPAAAPGEGIRNRLEVVDVTVENDALRNRPVAGEIVLGEERLQDLLFARSADVLRHARARPQILAVADLEHLDDRDPLLRAYRHDVDVPLRTVDVLALLHPPEAGDLVPVAGCELVVQTPRCGVHPCDEVFDHRLAPAFEEHRGVTDVVGVVGLVDEADARGAAAIDLVLKAGARPVAEEHVRALANSKELLDEGDCLPNRARVRVRTEVAPGGAAGAAVESEPRKRRVSGEVDPGVALVVAQNDVVAGPVLLDEVVFEQQRFRLRVGDGALHVGGTGKQRHALRVARAPAQP